MGVLLEGSAGGALTPPAPDWLAPSEPEPELVERLVGGLRLPPELCGVLAMRGLTDVEDAKRFLRPGLEHLHDPADLVDGARAAERIAQALREGETVLVHGDYDVDGICATAIYTRWLQSLGGSVVPFVPHRLRDGYDFGEAGLEAARRAGASLIVTADCGTVAHESVRRARERGIDVVVTDHHTVGSELPEAYAVVNPRRPDCPYPDKDLSGAGVAYKLCALVATELNVDTGALSRFLDLVALATVADLVPLTGENRVLVSHGLRRFRAGSVTGLGALLSVAGVSAEEVTTGKLGFTIAPRINAAGRIGESMDALRLLLTDDVEEAGVLAESLDRINQARQQEDRRTLVEALRVLGEGYDPASDFGIVLWSERWHPGVIGIVASRIVERVHRPVVLVALDGNRGRGSARSIPGFHLYEALSACSSHLDRFGGHRQAAGMDVARASLEAFREDFNAEARARLAGQDLRPVLRPDLEIPLSAADLDLAHWLSYLGPHGIGNPGPLFLARRVGIEGPRIVGEGHLKAVLSSGGSRLDGIGFGLAARHPPEALGKGRFDVLFRLERNEWRGRARAQARLVDLRPAEAA